MARWKLNTQHYLNVPGVEWEQQQTSQQTGKTVRYRHTVPQLLNPEDPGDWTDKSEQVIIVCWEGKGRPSDIVFQGDPTPDMEPWDEEAEDISASLQSKWVRPIDSLPGQGGFGEALLADLQKQLEAAIRNAATAVAQPATQSLSGVSSEAFAALQAQVEQLMQANIALQAKLSGAEAAEDEEPLPPDGVVVEPARAERRA